MTHLEECVRQVLVDLSFAFGKRQRGANTDQVVRVWCAALGRAHAEPIDIEAGVATLIESSEYMPNVATVCQAARDAYRARVGMVHPTPSDSSVFCPLCLTRDLIERQPRFRFAPFHRPSCPMTTDGQRADEAIGAWVWGGGQRPHGWEPNTLRAVQWEAAD